MGPDSWVSALDRRFQATIGRCQDSKFEVRSGTCWRRSAPGSSRREQPFFNPMQTFPSGFGEGRVGANNIADHLPGREVERTLRRRSHGQRTEHCGQKQMRWAEDFCRGLTPVVCANTNTATDFCPASISRLQRRQYKLSKDSVSCCPQSSVPVTVSKTLPFAQVCRKIPAH